MILQGDCLIKLKELEDNSVDSIVTDPPYELGFMGKKWDNSGIAYNVDMWKECLRVLKPGGHLLSFGGTRTYHRMACAIEDAGFEVRDMLEWIYASGFPKSLNIGKAVDKLQGNDREVVGKYQFPDGGIRTTDRTHSERIGQLHGNKHTPITKGNSEWEGFGTALKPAHEPIIMARKPLSEKTIVENVLKHGTGAIDIDGCRIPTSDTYSYPNGAGGNSFSVGEEPDGKRTEPVENNSLGRFPANIICTDDALNTGKEESRYFSADVWAEKHGLLQFPKASKREKNEGCENIEEKQTTGGGGLTADFREDGSLETASAGGKYGSIKAKQSNNHPTVKPIHLMSWLVRLVSKEGDTVLDPFMGSGTTGVACKKLGREFIGIELNSEYIEIAKARIKNTQVDYNLFG